MTPDPREPLRADCARCAALCCVAPAFARSADFPVDKPAGVPCPHLGAGFDCTVHDSLRPRGYVGCTVFDCFGAGQRVVQITFAGHTWRESPALAASQHAVFASMRALHELLWYLADARGLAGAATVHADLARMDADVRALRDEPSEVLAAADLAVGALRDRARPLLQRASALARAQARPDPPTYAGADLAGRDLRRADLWAADLRGALLIGCDLRRADLRCTDLIGADLRAADVRGADLGTAIYLTQFQVNGAHGDDGTVLPATLSRPPHWSGP